MNAGASTPRLRGSARLILLGVATLFALAAGEGLTRLAGHRPWPQPDALRNPSVYEPDPRLGWVHRPGVYHLPAFDPKMGPVTMTLWPDRSRATAATAKPDVAHRLAFVGCSVTQGWGVSDDHALPWLVQQRFPALDVRNFGTGGYSSYQTLLAVESLLTAAPPRWIVFGFGAFQERRNVAQGKWLIELAANARRGHVELPYVTLDAQGELVEHPPERAPDWPLLRRSALVALGHEAFLGFRTRARTAQAQAATFAIVRRMKADCERAGTKLVILLYQDVAPGADVYKRFLDDLGVVWVDGTRDLEEPMDRLLVPGDGHPNEILHARWARRLGDALASELTPGE